MLATLIEQPEFVAAVLLQDHGVVLEDDVGAQRQDADGRQPTSVPGGELLDGGDHRPAPLRDGAVPPPRGGRRRRTPCPAFGPRHSVLAGTVLQGRYGLEPLVRAPVRPVVQAVAARVGLLGLRLELGDQFAVQRQYAGTELLDVLQGITGAASELDLAGLPQEQSPCLPLPGTSCPASLSVSEAPGWLVSIRIVCLPLPGEVLGRVKQLPAHTHLELRQDVKREFGEVEVVGERQGNVHGPNIVADPGHKDDLAFVWVRHLQELLLRGVGEVIAAPRLHAHFAAHFHGGQEVRGTGPVHGVRDPELFNPHVVCHQGPHPRCCNHYSRGRPGLGSSTASICRFGPPFHGSGRDPVDVCLGAGGGMRKRPPRSCRTALLLSGL